MVDSRLLKYAKNQKKIGVHPGNLRYKLEEAGWSKEDVDKVVSEVYSAKRMVYVAFAFIILLVAFLAVLVVLLLRSPSTVVVDNNQTTSYNESNVLSCKNIIGQDLEKDACYRDEIKEGLNCNVLRGPFERTFCFRALEFIVLSSQ